MSKQTILVVDDEQDLLDLIEYNLRQEGFNVLKAENGKDGIQMAKENMPDLVLLDIMMPQMDGIEVCDRMREDSTLTHIPIIFLTARSDEKTEIEGLNKGADDFITKPISTSKLISRIKAVLRRFEETEEKVQKLKVHDLEIDKDRYIVTRGEEEFQLPRKEFELLYYLASKKGKVRDRQTLLNKVWGDNIYVVDRTVDVHVRKIREKLGDHYIETVKGVGYRFKE
ncbi:response regulator transcription factor [Rhodohalobacter sp. 614A]|uniref:response regulator transcription factor n=1 Tax=Rhodohalobacter sp. 614A TaxID=2908649 RepID=UPI001F20419F|nr:response regulator transcription factor [Rhodohalobacter sp. 614A]